MNTKLILIIIGSFTVGAIGGYSLSRSNTLALPETPSRTDVQIRGFAASYGTLRNIKEKDSSEAVTLMYTMMNNSIKEMYSLYPTASVHDKEMIYISFTGYQEYIQSNPIYNQTDGEINKLVSSLIKKHNNAFKRDAEKASRPLT